jgi:hypothetical protein
VTSAQHERTKARTHQMHMTYRADSMIWARGLCHVDAENADETFDVWIYAAGVMCCLVKLWGVHVLRLFGVNILRLLGFNASTVKLLRFMPGLVWLFVLHF